MECSYPTQFASRLHRRSTVSLVRVAAEFSSEFLGTALFAFFGGLGGSLSGPAAALANGLALAVLVTVTAGVSGGKLNPAVSVAVYLCSLFNRGAHWLWELGFLLSELTAQFTGAILGARLVRSLAYGGSSVGCFTPAPPGIPQRVVFGHETLAAFILTLSVLSTSVDAEGSLRFKAVAPICIGLALTVAALASGPYTGCAANPARAIAPAAVGACGDGAWLYTDMYVVGELFGAVLAALVHLLRVSATEPPPPPPPRRVMRDKIPHLEIAHNGGHNGARYSL